MNLVRHWIAIALMVAVGLAMADDFYVDATRGDDGWNGLCATSNGVDGTTGAVVGPKRTMVGVMSVVPTTGEHTVYAAEGVYGERVDTSRANYAARVRVRSNVRLIATGAQAQTILTGAESDEPNALGCGVGAVRCAVLEDGAYLQGFTLTGGRTPTAGNGGGVVLWNRGTVVDCCITNCIADERGGGAWDQTNCSSYPGERGRLVNCRVVGCTSAQPGAAVYRVDCWNTIVHNWSGYNGSYHGYYVNCTLLGNMANVKGYNCLVYALDNGSCVMSNCYSRSPSTSSTWDLPAQAPLPRVGYYQPAPTNVSIGQGDYDLYTNAFPQVAQAYLNKDVNGMARCVDGLLDVGAAAYAGPRDWFVDAEGGDDANAGNRRSKPLQTIRAAMARVRAGDTIHCAPGEYSAGAQADKWGSTNVVDFTKDNLTLVADEGAAVTTIRGLSSKSNGVRCVRIAGVAGGVVQGFTIADGGSAGTEDATKNHGGGLYGGTAIACVFTNCVAGGRGAASISATLVRCTVYPSFDRNNRAVQSGDCYSCVFRGSNYYGWGNKVVNCTFIGCSPLSNNTNFEPLYVYNSYIGARSAGTICRFYNCVLEGGLSALDTADAFTQSHLNVNAADYPFDPVTLRPTVGSLLLDAGDNAHYTTNAPAGLSAEDFCGCPRMLGASIDIGAGESATQDVLTVRANVSNGTLFRDEMQTLVLDAGSGRTIWYTTDWSNPTNSLTRKKYTEPISFTQSVALKYCAVDNVTGEAGEIQTMDCYYKKYPNGGPYSETVDGHTWHFRVVNGSACVGRVWSDSAFAWSAADSVGVIQSGETSATMLSPWGAVDETLSGDVSVPSELGGCPVTQIAPLAFYTVDTTNDVPFTLTIPAGVTTIGEYAFAGCATLSAVTLPDSLAAVGPHAFQGCASLASVDLPEAVAEVGAFTFYGCLALSALHLSDAITNIGSHAFCQCVSLPALAFPNDCRTLGTYVLYGCTTLTSITLPEGISIIGAGALSDCPNLTQVHMLGNAPQLSLTAYSVDNPFHAVGTLCTVYVKRGSTGWGVVPGVWNGLPVRYEDDAVQTERVHGIDWRYQQDGSSATLLRGDATDWTDSLRDAVVMPAAIGGVSVRALESGLCQGATRITSVSIPAGVTDIQSAVFQGCTRLAAVDLPEGLLAIGDNAFRECTSLASVTIPATVTNIGYFAFRDCLRLTNVTLLGSAPRQDLGAYMGVPAFTTLSGRLGAATAIVYASVTNRTEEITVPENWLEELAVLHCTPAGASSYEEAFKARYGEDLQVALTQPTGKHDLHGTPLYVWQDYVAGTDPLTEEDIFQATLTMEEGVPVVHWSPVLSPERAALRKYTIHGATALGGAWDDVSELTDVERQQNGYQFFWVSVEMR